MGTIIKLGLGNLQVDWGKNSSFLDHSALFQSNDIQNVRYRYAEGESVEKEAYSKPLSDVLPRLELLGHTLTAAKKEYAELLKFNDRVSVSFDELALALKRVKTRRVSLDYSDDYSFREFFSEEICDRIGLGKNITHQQPWKLW